MTGFWSFQIKMWRDFGGSQLIYMGIMPLFSWYNALLFLENDIVECFPNGLSWGLGRLRENPLHGSWFSNQTIFLRGWYLHHFRNGALMKFSSMIIMTGFSLISMKCVWFKLLGLAWENQFWNMSSLYGSFSVAAAMGEWLKRHRLICCCSRELSTAHFSYGRRENHRLVVMDVFDY